MMRKYLLSLMFVFIWVIPCLAGGKPESEIIKPSFNDKVGKSALFSWVESPEKSGTFAFGHYKIVVTKEITYPDIDDYGNPTTYTYDLPFFEKIITDRSAVQAEINIKDLPSAEYNGEYYYINNGDLLTFRLSTFYIWGYLFGNPLYTQNNTYSYYRMLTAEYATPSLPTSLSFSSPVYSSVRSNNKTGDYSEGIYVTVGGSVEPVLGVSSYTLQYSNSENFVTPTEVIIAASTGGVLLKDLDDTKYYFRVRANNPLNSSDFFGDPSQHSFTVDNTAPGYTFKSELKDKIYSSSIIALSLELQYNKILDLVTDATGIKAIQLVYPKYISSPIPLNTTVDYAYLITDVVNNSVTTTSKSCYIDTVTPTISAIAVIQTDDSQNNIAAIAFSGVNAHDEDGGSGIDSHTLNGDKINSVEITKPLADLTFATNFIHYAKDNVGNENSNTYTVNGKPVPISLNGKSLESSFLSPDAVHDSDIIVKLPLGITKEDLFKGYKSLTFSRETYSPDGGNDPSKNPTSYTLSIQNFISKTGNQYNIISSNNYPRLEGDNSNIFFVDRVQASAGNKMISYSLSGLLKPSLFSANISNRDSILLSCGSASARLINHPTKITKLILEDFSDSVQRFESGGAVVEGKVIKLSPSGQLKLYIEGFDIDGDDLIVDAFKFIGDPNDKMSVQIDMTAATEDYRIKNSYGSKSKLLKVGKNTPSNSVEEDFFLFNPQYGESIFGIGLQEVSKQTLSNSEKQDPGYKPDVSLYIKLQYEEQGITLEMAKDATNFGSKGISLRPYEQFKIAITKDENAGPTPKYLWDAGDGSKVGENTYSFTHAYEQSQTRKDDTSRYYLTLSESARQLKIPVTVIDTRFGTLLGNEVWWGKHLLLGEVIVPKSITLAIEDKEDQDPTSIETRYTLFQKSPSLIVDGNLKIKGEGDYSIALQKHGDDADELFPWQGIQVRAGGVANLENVLIEDAERGITVNSGGIATLNSCVIQENRIGVHILGTASLAMNGTDIVNNAIYGIKEDGLENPVVKSNAKDNALSGNGIDYYDSVQTNLTESEIDLLGIFQ